MARRPSWPTTLNSKAAKPGPFPETEALFAKRSFAQRARTAKGKVAKVWGLPPGEGEGLKSAKVPPTPYVYYPPAALTELCVRL